MNIPRILLSAALLAAVVTTAALSAAETKKAAAQAGQQDHGPEWAGLFGGASLPVVWQSAVAAAERIDAALAAKTAAGIAEWAETIHLAAHALEDQIKLDDAERAKRLKGALDQAAKIADAVIAGANRNDLDQAADAHRRLKAALALAKARLPKEILEAPKQAVRFAVKAPAEPASKK